MGVKDLFLYDLPGDCFDTLPILDVVKIVEELVQKHAPHTIFTHGCADLNVDHLITHRAVLTATRPIEGHCVRNLYVFEIPSSTDWSFHRMTPSFQPNTFFNIESTIDVKKRAMACYETEVQDFPHPRSLEGLPEVVGCRAAGVRLWVAGRPRPLSWFAAWYMFRSALKESEAPSFRIGQHIIGPGRPVFVIAELSGNHGQSFDAALKLIHLAKEAGADAIKLQTYTADTITIPSDPRSDARSDSDWFRIDGGTLWDGRTLHELYQESFTPWEWQPKLQIVARELGLELFASAFDPTAVDFLEQMQVPVHKIASPELVDIPLIEKDGA